MTVRVSWRLSNLQPETLNVIMQTFNSCSWPHKPCPADIVLQHSCCQIQRPPAAVVNSVPPQSGNARTSQYAGSGRMLWARRSLDCCTNALSGALRPVAALPGKLEVPVDDSHLPATGALLSLPRRRITPLQRVQSTLHGMRPQRRRQPTPQHGSSSRCLELLPAAFMWTSV